jgi:predicted ester cyclase
MSDTLTSEAVDVVRRSIEIMASGDIDDFVAIIHPEATNREAVQEPPDTRGRGPEAFYATALWLRAAYADLHWDVHDVVVSGDLVVLHCTMSGRHVGDFVTYDADGRVERAFPATGRRFATTQSHWFRVADGKVIEHWANRDDLGTATQLGWVPPTPAFLLRSALATRRARRAARA